MARLKQRVNGYEIYELTPNECRNHERIYPTYCAWKYEEDIGNMSLTETEEPSLSEAIKWCSTH